MENIDEFFNKLSALVNEHFPDKSDGIEKALFAVQSLNISLDKFSEALSNIPPEVNNIFCGKNPFSIPSYVFNYIKDQQQQSGKPFNDVIQEKLPALNKYLKVEMLDADDKIIDAIEYLDNKKIMLMFRKELKAAVERIKSENKEVQVEYSTNDQTKCLKDTVYVDEFGEFNYVFTIKLETGLEFNFVFGFREVNPDYIETCLVFNELTGQTLSLPIEEMLKIKEIYPLLNQAFKTLVQKYNKS